MGAGDLDLSIRFLFTFGDFLAVRIPEPDKTWDLGIYLGDADDTKRGYLVYMLSSGSVRVRADCIKLDVSEDVKGVHLVSKTLYTYCRKYTYCSICR